MADRLPYTKIAVVAVVAVIMLFGLSIIGSYNGLVQSEQLVHQKESQYGVALKRSPESGQSLIGMLITSQMYLSIQLRLEALSMTTLRRMGILMVQRSLPV